MSTRGLIARADFLTQMDNLCTAYKKLIGTSASGFGLGEPNASYGVGSAVAAISSSLFGSNYEDAIVGIGLALQGFQDSLRSKTLFGQMANALLVAYGQHAYSFQPDTTVVSLDTLLSYWNTGGGGTWQALLDFSFYDIFVGARKSAPSVSNLYFEVLSGAFTTGLDHQYTNGLGKFIVSGAGAGAFTSAVVEGWLIDDGSAHGTIDSTKYAGGFPQVRTSGLAGSGNLTVSCDIYDPVSKAVQTGKTLIFNIAGNGVDSTVTGGTAPANALILHVTGISIVAGITAGTMYVEAARPAGRPLVQ